jgi:hypothetical protein
MFIIPKSKKAAADCINNRHFYLREDKDMICDDCTMKDVCKYKETCKAFEEEYTTTTAEGVISVEVKCKYKQIAKPTPRPQLTPGTWEKKDHPYKPMEIQNDQKPHGGLDPYEYIGWLDRL